MEMRDLTSGEKEDLERLIDKTGLQAVLMALSEICGEKAGHIESMWQDRVTARVWSTLEGAIGAIVPKANYL
jgi:hypothetical protein